MANCTQPNSTCVSPCLRKNYLDRMHNSIGVQWEPLKTGVGSIARYVHAGSLSLRAQAKFNTTSSVNGYSSCRRGSGAQTHRWIRFDEVRKARWTSTGVMKMLDKEEQLTELAELIFVPTLKADRVGTSGVEWESQTFYSGAGK
jgi:hypothetical protein